MQAEVYIRAYYMDYFELNDSTYIEIMDNKTEKDIVASEKVQEMYDKFLNIDGDVEYVLLWYDEEYKGQGMLSDTNVRDICKWLANP